MKVRSTNTRWAGGKRISVAQVSDDDIAARGHRQVKTRDDLGFTVKVTLRAAPWDRDADQQQHDGRT